MNKRELKKKKRNHYEKNDDGAWSKAQNTLCRDDHNVNDVGTQPPEEEPIQIKAYSKIKGKQEKKTKGD